MLGVVVLVGVGAWLLLQGQAAGTLAKRVAIQYRGFRLVGYSLKNPGRLPAVVFFDVFNPTLNAVSIRAITGTVKLDGRIVGLIKRLEPLEIRQLATVPVPVPVELNVGNALGRLLPTLLAETASKEELELELLVTIGSSQFPLNQKFPLPALPEGARQIAASVKNKLKEIVLNTVSKVIKGGKR